MVSFGNSPNIWLMLLMLKLTFCHVLRLIVHDMQGQSVARLLHNSHASSSTSPSMLEWFQSIVSLYHSTNLQATHPLTHSMSLDYPVLPFAKPLHIQLADRQHVGSNTSFSCLQE